MEKECFKYLENPKEDITNFISNLEQQITEVINGKNFNNDGEFAKCARVLGFTIPKKQCVTLFNPNSIDSLKDNLSTYIKLKRTELGENATDPSLEAAKSILDTISANPLPKGTVANQLNIGLTESEFKSLSNGRLADILSAHDVVLFKPGQSIDECIQKARSLNETIQPNLSSSDYNDNAYKKSALNTIVSALSSKINTPWPGNLSNNSAKGSGNRQLRQNENKNSVLRQIGASAPARFANAIKNKLNDTKRDIISKWKNCFANGRKEQIKTTQKSNDENNPARPK